MKTFKKPILYFAVALLSGIIFYGCKKDNDGPYGVPVQNAGKITTTISGMVLDENNASLEGVTVNAYGQTTTTNQFGIFVLQNVSVAKSRCIVNYSKAGYFNRADAFIPTANTVNYVRIVMISDAQTHTVNTSTGGTITLPDGSSVQFPANGFVVASSGAAYNGTVTITFKHLMPGTPNFGFTIPGGDLAGKNLGGDDVTLYTFGMIGVELTGSGGEALQLANGKTATITMPVAPMQMAEAKPTIPLWYFNESTALWMEEGSATLIGNNYVGTVSHFTWWNYDYQGPRATLKGKVVDCNGTPMPNVNVTINGWYNTTTNSLGEYQDDVPVNMVFTVQVLGINNQSLLNSQIENIPMLTNGQVYIVSTLIVPCPSRIAGTLKTCTGNAPTAGIVYVTSTTGFSDYQFTSSGAFNIAVPENMQVQLTAYSAIASANQTLTSLTTPNVSNIGNVLLCDTTSGSNGNNFILNGGTFLNLVYDVVPTLAEGSYNSWINHVEIMVQGISTSGLAVFTYDISLSDTIPGAYSFNTGTSYVYINTTDGNKVYQIYSPQGNGIGVTNLTEFGPVGGRIKGNFSGDADFIADSAWFTGTFSGNFDVLRTQ